ncbi:MAG: hypothetical protein IPK98_12340 [Chloracidobacterium sp.]|nr:hypothetical protein [Chloracidobacterium sp.]
MKLKRTAEGVITANRYSQTAATDNLLELYDRMYEDFVNSESALAGDEEAAVAPAV